MTTINIRNVTAYHDGDAIKVTFETDAAVPAHYWIDGDANVLRSHNPLGCDLALLADDFRLAVNAMNNMPMVEARPS